MSIKINQQNYNGQTLIMLINDETNKPIIEASSFLKNLYLKNKSINTRLAYAYHLAAYFRFLDKEKLSLTKVSNLRYKDQVEHFCKFLWVSKNAEKKVLSNNTCNAYLKTVLAMYEFLGKNGELKPLSCVEEREIEIECNRSRPMRRIIKKFDGLLDSEDTPKKDVLEKEVINQMIQVCRNLRDQVLLMILRDSGIRISEALGIKQKDINWEKEEIYIKYRQNNENGALAKEHSNRTIYPSNDTFRALRKYLCEYPELLRNSEYLFVVLKGKTRGRALTRNATEKIFEAISKRIVRNVTPHEVRHFFATNLYDYTGDLLIVKDALGHKDISTTERYIGKSEEKMRDAIKNLNKEMEYIDVNSDYGRGA